MIYKDKFFHTRRLKIMAFDTNRDTIVTRTGALEIDEGLRQYMLKVYNYMTIGLLITAGVSFFWPILL